MSEGERHGWEEIRAWGLSDNKDETVRRLVVLWPSVSLTQHKCQFRMKCLSNCVKLSKTHYLKLHFWGKSMAPLLYPDQHRQLMVSITGQEPSSIQVSRKIQEKNTTFSVEVIKWRAEVCCWNSAGRFHAVFVTKASALWFKHCEQARH